jgi:hypothetical protein
MPRRCIARWAERTHVSPRTSCASMGMWVHGKAAHTTAVLASTTSQASVMMRGPTIGGQTVRQLPSRSATTTWENVGETSLASNPRSVKARSGRQKPRHSIPLLRQYLLNLLNVLKFQKVLKVLKVLFHVKHLLRFCCAFGAILVRVTRMRRGRSGLRRCPTYHALAYRVRRWSLACKQRGTCPAGRLCESQRRCGW